MLEDLGKVNWAKDVLSIGKSIAMVVPKDSFIFHMFYVFPIIIL